MSRVELQPETMIRDTYRVVRFMGRGGMSQVFEVEHARLSGRYALKLLDPTLASDAEMLGRFQREAEIASGLRHPNIVQVIDFNATESGAPFLVMEYLEGRDLKAYLRREGPMTAAATARWIADIASALGAAHSSGIVHRDLKPENIFVCEVLGRTDPVLKVLDFGISKVKAATTQLTGPTNVMGTPHYMSPEQARGDVAAIDGRTDQFALGAIAYEMLTGEVAFRGEDVASILYQVVHETPPRLIAGEPLANSAVGAVLGRALAKSAASRFASVAEFAAALSRAGALVGDDVRQGHPTGNAGGEAARRTTDVASPRPSDGMVVASSGSVLSGAVPARRSPLLPAVIAIAVVALGAVGWATFGRRAATAPGDGALAVPAAEVGGAVDRIGARSGQGVEALAPGPSGSTAAAAAAKKTEGEPSASASGTPPAVRPGDMKSPPSGATPPASSVSPSAAQRPTHRRPPAASRRSLPTASPDVSPVKRPRTYDEL